MSRLASPVSPSTSRVFNPARASIAPRLAVSRLFPTPPLPLATVITLAPGPRSSVTELESRALLHEFSESIRLIV